MLNYRNYIIFFVLVSSTVFSQSLLNGFGIGNKIAISDASSMSVSSTGLLPSFNKGISLQNPSTWRKLDFTYFTGTYQLERRVILDDLNNDISNIGYAQFVVPIKNKYAFGLGIRPYLNQYLELDGSSIKNFIAYGDTLTTKNSYSSFGGVAAFSFSVGGRLIENLDVAITLDLLYGSTRQQTIYSISELDYYSQKRNLYTGSLAKIFITSDLLSIWKIPLTAYLGFGFPLKSISVESINYSPFEDSNNSGELDNPDFPRLGESADPVIENTDNVSSPNELQFGFDYSLNDRWNILGEYYRWTDNQKNAVNFSKLNDQIESIDRFNIGIAKFSPKLAKNFFDRMNYKVAAYSSNITPLNSKKSIKEYGLSTGLSFNFGFTKNQIDFAYSIGRRQGLLEIGDENIQKFSIGITVGDIWFVKRRSQ